MRAPSLSNTQAFTGQLRRHSTHNSSAVSLQNQRVAAILQSTGHSINTTAHINRFNPTQHQQFYSPASSPYLQQQRQTRPQVPLFSQSTGNIPQTPKMVMEGLCYASNTADSFDSQVPADQELFTDDGFTPFGGGDSTDFATAYSSPAIAPYDYNSNLSSSSLNNMDTVSPKDLHQQGDFSAPNSTAFTNLTSPSVYDVSPEYAHDFSPFYDNADNELAALSGDPWYPLFPQEELADQPSMDQSPLLAEEELEVSETLRRRRSGAASSPLSGTHSSVSGVNAKKRDKPLPPIVVEDPNDTVAMKRARNTLAARKSRQRKMQRFEELEDQIDRLTVEKDDWKAKYEALVAQHGPLR